MPRASTKIGTWPTPEKPISLKIPIDLLKEFQKEPHIVIRHPWVVGIPAAEVLISKIAKNPALYRKIKKEFDFMLVPK